MQVKAEELVILWVIVPETLLVFPDDQGLTLSLVFALDMRVSLHSHFCKCWFTRGETSRGKGGFP